MSEERLVPKLRFIEETWSSEKLGNLCKITMGQSPSSKNYSKNSNDTILIQGNADLISGKIVPRIYTSEITKLSYPGDIILTVRAPVGDLAINEFDSCIGRGVCSIKGNKFIYYYLESLKDKHVWERLSQGSTFESVNSNDIKNLNLKIPSNSTQNHIINFFTAIDTKIELLQKKHGEYIRFKQYLMQNIFADKSAEKLRFDFKDTWDKVLLKDVAFIPKKTKLTNVEGLKLLTVKLHTKGIEINDRIKPKLTKRGRPYYIRRSGELLIGRQNFHNGGMGIVPKSLDGGICSNAISSFNVFEDKIDVNYLYYFLARPEYYIKSERLIGGTGQKEFSEKELLKLKIDLPSLEEQNKIVDFLLNIDHKIELSENQLNKTQEFKKGLLQQMFDNMLLFKL